MGGDAVRRWGWDWNPCQRGASAPSPNEAKAEEPKDGLRTAREF